MFTTKKVIKGETLNTIELSAGRAVVQAVQRNGWAIVDSEGTFTGYVFHMKEAATRQCEWMNRKAA